MLALVPAFEAVIHLSVWTQIDQGVADPAGVECRPVPHNPYPFPASGARPSLEIMRFGDRPMPEVRSWLLDRLADLMVDPAEINAGFTNYHELVRAARTQLLRWPWRGGSGRVDGRAIRTLGCRIQDGLWAQAWYDADCIRAVVGVDTPAHRLNLRRTDWEDLTAGLGASAQAADESLAKVPMSR